MTERGRKDPDSFTVDTSRVGELLNGLSGRFGDGGRDGDAPPAAGPKRRKRRDTPDRSTEKQETRSKYTVLLAESDALTLDELALAMRRRTGRKVEKSEMLRVLIRLTDDDEIGPALTNALGAELERRTAL